MLAVGLVPCFATPASAASPVAHWWAPVSIDSSRIDSVACASPTLCLAGDAYGNVLSSTDPIGGAAAWSSSVASAGHSLTGIACPSTSLCVGADNYGYVATSTNPTGGASAWHVKKIAGTPSKVGLEGVSCPTTTLCVALESLGGVFYSTNPAAESWEDAGELNVSGADTYPIACPTSTLCVVGDTSGHVLTTTTPTGAASSWSSANVAGSDAVTSISCPSASICVATSEGNVLASTNPAGGAAAWSNAQVSNFYIRDVACYSATLCVAIDEENDLFVSTNPTGGAAAWPKVAETTEYIDAIACPSESLCLAAGGFGGLVIGSDQPPIQHKLTVTKAGTGTGSVSSSPSGVECGLVCSYSFDQGTDVSLLAYADQGSKFTGWSGACSGSEPCELTLDADAQVTAHFTSEEAPAEEHAPSGGESPPSLVEVHKPRPKKRLRCRKGFKKRKVHGKTKCVKVKHRSRHKAARLSQARGRMATRRATSRTSLSWTLPRSANEGVPIPFSWSGKRLGSRHRLVIQKPEGTAHTWRTIMRLATNSGSAELPGLALGKYRFRIVDLVGRQVLAQKAAGTAIFGQVPFTTLFDTDATRAYTMPTATFPYVRSYDSVVGTPAFTVDHNHCSFVHIAFVSGSSYTTYTSVVTLVQESKDPVSVSVPTDTIGSLDAALVPGQSWSLNLDTIGGESVYYINGYAICSSTASIYS
jgi:hypothetical protein